MIQAIGAIHATLRAKKRAEPPKPVVVEIRKRRRLAAAAEHVRDREASLEDKR